MTSRSVRAFFNDLGIVAHFARPRHPNDNASCESWFATYKGERLWHTDYAAATPTEVVADLDGFVAYYKGERLHQGIGYVTPAERHDGTAPALIEARRQGMQAVAAQDLDGRLVLGRGLQEHLPLLLGAAAPALRCVHVRLLSRGSSPIEEAASENPGSHVFRAAICRGGPGATRCSRGVAFRGGARPKTREPRRT